MVFEIRIEKKITWSEILLRTYSFYSSYFFQSIFTNPSTRAIYDKMSIFKWGLIGLNSEFSFSKTCCLTKPEEPTLSYYLPFARGRIIGYIPFPRVLVLCKMQSVSSKIWTRVSVSISNDDNHYTTDTLFSFFLSIYLSWRWFKNQVVQF